MIMVGTRWLQGRGAVARDKAGGTGARGLGARGLGVRLGQRDWSNKRDRVAYRPLCGIFRVSMDGAMGVCGGRRVPRRATPGPRRATRSEIVVAGRRKPPSF